jgi:alpha-aminoadipate carrier protein LysW
MAAPNIPFDAVEPREAPGRLAAGACMATCPECDADMEVDEFDVDKGDLISCPECGSNLEVTSLLPLELELADDDDDDDDDDEEDDVDEEEAEVVEDDVDDDKEDWDE